jgi:hypothetical protein
MGILKVVLAIRVMIEAQGEGSGSFFALD